MKKFLLIGSDGYLGSNFKKFLNKKKRRVIRLDYADYYILKRDIENKIKNSYIIVHFAIPKNINNLKEFDKEIIRSKFIFKLIKYHKKKCIYISSISADLKNKSFYSSLKLKLENYASKNNFTIIRPGMVWDKKPRSWFKEVDNFAKKFLLFFPMLGEGNKPLYTVELNQFMKILLKIAENKKGKFVVHDNKIFNFIKIFRFCLKRYEKKGIIIFIPLTIIYPLAKLFNLIKLIDNQTYDSLISYKYSSYKKFNSFKVIKTTTNFEYYSKIRHNNSQY